MALQQERIAQQIATKAHTGQVDKAGKPYIEHPAYVAAHVSGDNAKAVAWLHDTLEDTDTTSDDLYAAGLCTDVVDAVMVLTHQKGVPYFEYIERVATNKLAAMVKIADLKHNMKLERLSEISHKDLERVDKYKTALDFLLSSISN